MTKLHLPSLQAAAALAAATPKDKSPLRLVQIVRRPGGGQSYLATCSGHAAIRCDHPCRVPAPKGTYLSGKPPAVDVLLPVEDTELRDDRTLLVWADSVPSKKPTKAEVDAGAWVDLEGSDLVYWAIGSGAREVRLGSDGPKLPGEPGLTRLLGVPDLSQLLREFIPGNYAAGHAGRFSATYLALFAKAAELMARGYAFDGLYGRTFGDTPSLELFADDLREGSSCIVDLTAQRWDDPAAPTAWGLLMPIQRRDKEARRGRQLVEAAA
jgi:hypothetical protein